MDFRRESSSAVAAVGPLVIDHDRDSQPVSSLVAAWVAIDRPASQGYHHAHTFGMALLF